jgi:hypothetical protein
MVERRGALRAARPVAGIAITNTIDGRNVEWLEQVSDGEYAGHPRR